MVKAKADFSHPLLFPLLYNIMFEIITIMSCLCYSLYMCYSSQRVHGHPDSVSGWKESVSMAYLETYQIQMLPHCVSGTGDSLLWLSDYIE